MPAGGDGPKGTIPYQRRRDGWGEGGGTKGGGEREGGGGTSSLTCRFMCFCQGLVTLGANYSCFSSAGKLDNGHPLQYFQSLKINLYKYKAISAVHTGASNFALLLLFA